MLHKTAVITARIEPFLKLQAEDIFNKIGLSSAEAIRIFYKHVCLNAGLPFEVKIPNKLTCQAMREATERKTYKAKNVDALFEELE